MTKYRTKLIYKTNISVFYVFGKGKIEMMTAFFIRYINIVILFDESNRKHFL